MGCDNDRIRYPEKQNIIPHVGILRFYSPKNKRDLLSWARAINRDQFKVTMSTKVCSNHFIQAGYRTSRCPIMSNFVQARKLSVHFIRYFKIIQTKTYIFHVSILSKSISDKIMAKKR